MADLDTEFGDGADAPVAESAQQREPTAPSRDDSGRFAGRQEPPEPEAGAEEQPPEGEGQAPEQQRTVPHAALHAAREEAKGYKEKFGTLEARFEDQSRQIQHLLTLMGGQNRQQPAQAPEQSPDWFQDPDAAFAHNIKQAVDPIQSALQSQREGFSQMLAVKDHGADVVQAAQRELEQRVRSNPEAARYDYQRIMASPHPYEELVNWHKQQSALQRVGSDPDAFIEAEVTRRLAAMGHAPQPQQAAPQQQPAAPGAMPSNFAGGRSAAPRGGAGNTSGPRPLSDIFGGR